MHLDNIQKSELQDSAISADLLKHSLVFRIQRYKSLISIVNYSAAVKVQAYWIVVSLWTQMWYSPLFLQPLQTLNTGTFFLTISISTNDTFADSIHQPFRKIAMLMHTSLETSLGIE